MTRSILDGAQRAAQSKGDSRKPTDFKKSARVFLLDDVILGETMKCSQPNPKGVRQMKANPKTAVITTALIALALGSVAIAVPTAKDPTKYDCRVVVGYKVVDRGSKPPFRLPIFACPHKDKMAAGECETSWLFGMRCKK